MQAIREHTIVLNPHGDLFNLTTGKSLINKIKQEPLKGTCFESKTCDI